jgi:hypothetical protein
MTELLSDLNLEIAAYVHELHELTKVIKDMDQTLIKESTVDNQMLMQECIDRYKSSVDRLKTLLECYFAEEKKEGLPADFSFRRLYSKIRKS